MNYIRRFIRQILMEDKAAFEKDYTELLKDAGVKRGNIRRLIRFSDKKFGKQIKRLWNQNADHQWFAENIDTIHFSEEPGELLNWPSGISKDEISCTMHLKNQKIKTPSLYGGSMTFGYIGLMVKGRITLAVNDMDFAITGFKGKYDKIPKEEYRQQKSSSGINKYPDMGPNLFKPGWNNLEGTENPYAFDAQTFEKNNSEYNEALVDNWKVVAIVAPRDVIEYAAENPDMTGDQAFIYDLLDQFQVPVLDLDRNDLTKELLA